MDISLFEPRSFTAGDTVIWKRNLSDYPASAAWVLSYTFNGPDKYTATATASGDDFLITLTAAVTAVYLPGYYAWQGYVTKGTERYTIGTGSFAVVKNLTALPSGVAYEARSHARKTYEAIQAVMENRATVDQQEYQIAGRMLKRFPIGDLIALFDKYSALVKSEDRAAAIANGTAKPNQLFVRF